MGDREFRRITGYKEITHPTDDAVVYLAEPGETIPEDIDRKMTWASIKARLLSLFIPKVSGAADKFAIFDSNGNVVNSGYNKQDVSPTGGPTFSGGVKTDNVLLKTKVIEIGDWDMVAVGLVTFTMASLGITASKIRMIYVAIRADSPFGGRTDPIEEGGQVWWSTNDVSLLRDAGGSFDNTDYDETSYNRGWVTILYEA